MPWIADRATLYRMRASDWRDAAWALDNPVLSACYILLHHKPGDHPMFIAMNRFRVAKGSEAAFERHRGRGVRRLMPGSGGGNKRG
jgi:hypothetical protein